MLAEIPHKPLVSNKAGLHGFGKGDEKFTMEGRANVSNFVRHLISFHACFGSNVVIEVFLCSVTFNPRESHSMNVFELNGFVEVFPQISITDDGVWVFGFV